jgi:hypothetical protein
MSQPCSRGMSATIMRRPSCKCSRRENSIFWRERCTCAGGFCVAIAFSQTSVRLRQPRQSPVGTGHLRDLKSVLTIHELRRGAMASGARPCAAVCASSASRARGVPGATMTIVCAPRRAMRMSELKVPSTSARVRDHQLNLIFDQWDGVLTPSHKELCGRCALTACSIPRAPQTWERSQGPPPAASSCPWAFRPTACCWPPATTRAPPTYGPSSHPGTLAAPGLAASSFAAGAKFAGGVLRIAVGCADFAARDVDGAETLDDCTMQIVGLSDVTQRTRRRCGLVQMG